MCNHTYHTLYLFCCLPPLSAFEVFSSHRQKHPKESWSVGPSVNDWRHPLIHRKVSLKASNWATAGVATQTRFRTAVHQQVWSPHPAWTERRYNHGLSKQATCMQGQLKMAHSIGNPQRASTCLLLQPTFQRHVEKITRTDGGAIPGWKVLQGDGGSVPSF